MRKNETQNAEKVLVVMTLLMNLLILTSTGCVIWVGQLIVSQSAQINDLINGFRLGYVRR